MFKIISQNPYRVLGVLSNSPLRERVGNQNRLAAFAKVGKDVSFPNDFTSLIAEKPLRDSDSLTTAIASLNLDKEQLKHALIWFIKDSAIDNIALNYVQTGNIDKARELFEKKETFSSLINLGVLYFITGDNAAGLESISKVLHDDTYRSGLLSALGLDNLQMTEEEMSKIFIETLIKEVAPTSLLKVASHPTDKAIISKIALDEPISTINAAISAAQTVDSKNSSANLQAGTKLMKSTKQSLEQVKEVAGVRSAQYRMVADNVAKTVLQCGINYYNNAPDSDTESPRKAMVLQAYALKIAVGPLTKERCQENYDILKVAVENMPPAEVAVEAGEIKAALGRFCQRPDKIDHSITLLNDTKPLLQSIKNKLGYDNKYYLSISTRVVNYALHNLIEEVNQAQNHLNALFKAAKERGLDPSILNYIGGEHSPAHLIDTKLKPVLRQAWRATKIMDSFDMEADFKKDRYLVNRKSLKELCDSLNISTYTPRPGPTPAPNPGPTPAPNPGPQPDPNAPDQHSGWIAFWCVMFITGIIGAIINGTVGLSWALPLGFFLGIGVKGFVEEL